MLKLSSIVLHSLAGALLILLGAVLMPFCALFKPSKVAQ
jgi:hypothetical protein